jgi:3-isopropylmalate dehydrogenase
MAIEIATIEGDGIGPEVTQATINVLREACGRDALEFVMLEGGAGAYRKSGHVLPPETAAACASMAAILHGAAGLPDVVFPDGTEVGNELHLRLRFDLDLYANVRPIKLLPGVRSPLRDAEDTGIDYVIVRENTEGLYASRGGGIELRDEVATDTLLITRKGTDRVARFALDLARRRSGALRDGKSRVTVCDKANILRSFAFFRKVCDEAAADYPDVEMDYSYVDAMTVHLVKRPDFYDVIVAENLLGDIISDLGAATVGGMGISPSGEYGPAHALFQGSHGSAPDIAGLGVASPIATILSGVLMLRWLAEREQVPTLGDAADRIDVAVAKVLAEQVALPRDLGGQAGCAEVTQAICRALQ